MQAVFRVVTRVAVSLALLFLLAPRVGAGEILFLVGESPAFFETCVHCDSYVLPLSEAGDIAHARLLIAQGGVAPLPIVIARIELGADGQNRDYLAPGSPEWNWHVAEFIGFTDGVPEILDGWPGSVEAYPDFWMENTEGWIGFATYTVVREIPEPEIGLQGLVALATLARRRVVGLSRGRVGVGV